MFRRSGSKYGNVKVLYENQIFDSKRELKRYKELQLLEKFGEISGLTTQPAFTLQDGFTDFSGHKQRQIVYRADFQYRENGNTVVEDAKGHKTKEYLLKKKLFLFRFPSYIFREV